MLHNAHCMHTTFESMLYFCAALQVISARLASQALPTPVCLVGDTDGVQSFAMSRA